MSRADAAQAEGTLPLAKTLLAAARLVWPIAAGNCLIVEPS